MLIKYLRIDYPEYVGLSCDFWGQNCTSILEHSVDISVVTRQSAFGGGGDDMFVLGL